MLGGSFIKTISGNLWVVPFGIKVKGELAEMLRVKNGRHVFAMRFLTQEDGNEVCLTETFPWIEAYEKCVNREECKRLGIPPDLVGEMMLDGQPVDVADIFNWQFAEVRHPDGRTHLAWRWQLALEAYRGRPLGETVLTRSPTPAEL